MRDLDFESGIETLSPQLWGLLSDLYSSIYKRLEHPLPGNKTELEEPCTVFLLPPIK